MDSVCQGMKLFFSHSYHFKYVQFTCCRKSLYILVLHLECKKTVKHVFCEIYCTSLPSLIKFLGTCLKYNYPILIKTGFIIIMKKKVLYHPICCHRDWEMCCICKINVN